MTHYNQIFAKRLTLYGEVFMQSVSVPCTAIDCMNTDNTKTEASTVQGGSIVKIGTPVFINPKGKEWTLDYTSAILAVLVEGPFRTPNDTFFRAISIRLATPSRATDEVELTYDVSLTCLLWMEFPVSKEQFQLWNPTRPLKRKEFQKLLSARGQYLRGLTGNDSLGREAVVWRNRFLERNQWVMSIADYRRTILDELFESRN